jgi:hypothetical protein
MRYYRLKCQPDSSITFEGPSRDTIKKMSLVKAMDGKMRIFPFPGSPQLEEIRSCKELGVNRDTAFDLDLREKIDGLYSTGKSEVMVTEIIGDMRLVIKDLEDWPYFRVLLQSQDGKLFKGTGYDWGTDCPEMIPFEAQTTLNSTSEIVLEITYKENSCGMKSGQSESLLLVKI